MRSANLKRRLLRLFSGLSLVLLVLCIISFWYSLGLDLSYDAGETTFHAWLADGLAGFSTTHGSMGLIGGDKPPIWWYSEFHHSETNGYAAVIELNTIGFLLILLPWPLAASLSTRNQSRSQELYRRFALVCTFVGIAGYLLPL